MNIFWWDEQRDLGIRPNSSVSVRYVCESWNLFLGCPNSWGNHASISLVLTSSTHFGIRLATRFCSRRAVSRRLYILELYQPKCAHSYRRRHLFRISRHSPMWAYNCGLQTNMLFRRFAAVRLVTCWRWRHCTALSAVRPKSSLDTVFIFHLRMTFT